MRKYTGYIVIAIIIAAVLFYYRSLLNKEDLEYLHRQKLAENITLEYMDRVIAVENSINISKDQEEIEKYQKELEEIYHEVGTRIIEIYTRNN